MSDAVMKAQEERSKFYHVVETTANEFVNKGKEWRGQLEATRSSLQQASTASLEKSNPLELLNSLKKVDEKNGRVAEWLALQTCKREDPSSIPAKVKTFFFRRNRLNFDLKLKLFFKKEYFPPTYFFLLIVY